MPQVLLETETHGHAFVPSFLESDSIETGKAYSSGPAVVTYRGGYSRRAWGVPDISEFILTWAASKSAEVIAEWLYTKARGKVETMRINRREVRVEKEDILSVLREANATSDHAEADGE